MCHCNVSNSFSLITEHERLISLFYIFGIDVAREKYDIHIKRYSYKYFQVRSTFLCIIVGNPKKIKNNFLNFEITE